MTGETDTSLLAIIGDEVTKVSVYKLTTDDLNADCSLWSFDAGAAGLSSLDFLELVYRVEQRLGVNLPPDLEPAQVPTLGVLAELVGRSR